MDHSGKTLRFIRRALDLTQREVAQTLGLSQPTIAQIERGARPLTNEEAEAFERAYDVPVSVVRQPKRRAG